MGVQHVMGSIDENVDNGPAEGDTVCPDTSAEDGHRVFHPEAQFIWDRWGCPVCNLTTNTKFWST